MSLVAESPAEPQGRKASLEAALLASPLGWSLDGELTGQKEAATSCEPSACTELQI